MNILCKRSIIPREFMFQKTELGEVIFIVALLLLTAANAHAAGGKVFWQPDGVLVTGIDGMGIGDLVTDMRGGAYILTGDTYHVYGIRIDKTGSLTWGINGVTVDTAPTGAIIGPMVGTSDGHGGVIGVWRWEFTWGYNLYYQRIDSLGNKVWGTSKRMTLSDSMQDNQQVVSDGHGGVIAAWQEQRNGQWDIYAQRVDSNGIRQWGNYGKVVCNATNDQESMSLICDSSGNSVIAWADLRNTQSQIYMDRFNLLGQSLWQVNGKHICPTDSGQGLPGYGSVMAYTATGSIFIAWHDYRNGNNDVYAQMLNIDGSLRWPTQGIVVCDTDSLQGSGQVVPDNRGGAIVCWIDHRDGHYNLFAQRLDSNGVAEWQMQGVPICLSDSVYWYHRITSDYRSGAIVCWQDNRSGVYHIYAQRVDSSGNMKWQANGMPVCTALPYGQEYPYIIPADSGTAIVAWDDGRSGWGRGYAQRIGDDPNGVVGTPLPAGKCESRMEQNHPNPFSGSTTISYQLSQPGKVSLKVYNIAGQIIKTLVDDIQAAGHHSVVWDGRNNIGQQVTGGVYICRMNSAKYQCTNKLLLMR